MTQVLPVQSLIRFLKHCLYAISNHSAIVSVEKTIQVPRCISVSICLRKEDREGNVSQYKHGKFDGERN